MTLQALPAPAPALSWENAAVAGPVQNNPRSLSRCQAGAAWGMQLPGLCHRCNALVAWPPGQHQTGIQTSVKD